MVNKNVQSSKLKEMWTDSIPCLRGSCLSLGNPEEKHFFLLTLKLHSYASGGPEMATHSSLLAWRIPGTEEPGGLLSTGLHRVGHD